MLSIYWGGFQHTHTHTYFTLPNYQAKPNQFSPSIMYDFAAVRDKISWFHNINTCGVLRENHFSQRFFLFLSLALLTIKEYIQYIHMYNSILAILYILSWATYERGGEHIYTFFHNKMNAAVGLCAPFLRCLCGETYVSHLTKPAHATHYFMYVRWVCVSTSEQKTGYIFYHST